MLEQRWIKHLATLRKLKESNTAINGDLAAHKISMKAQQHNDNEDKKPVLLTQVVSALALIPTNAVTIENDDDDLDEEHADYINALLNFKRDF